MKQYYEKKEKKIKNKYLLNKHTFLKQLLKSYGHLGHSLKDSHPKSFNYLIGFRSKQSIINLEYTVQSLQRSFLLIEKILLKTVKNKKLKILIICNDSKTDFIEKEFKDHPFRKRMKFVCKKWVGGTLTNSLKSKNLTENVSLILSFNNIENNLIIKEAKINKIPLIAIINTDMNPGLIDYPIVVNNDNLISIKFLVFLFKKYLYNVKI